MPQLIIHRSGTILGAYYIDGGILSIIIFTIFSGFLIGLLSRVHEEERSIESFFYYSIYVCFLTIWTHMKNHPYMILHVFFFININFHFNI